jgi:hypothetical protein
MAVAPGAESRCPSRTATPDPTAFAGMTVGNDAV